MLLCEIGFDKSMTDGYNNFGAIPTVKPQCGEIMVLTQHIALFRNIAHIHCAAQP